MRNDSEPGDWPAEAGDPRSLPLEMQPPTELEGRVVDALSRRGLIEATTPPRARHVGWRVMRTSFAVAACVALLAIGLYAGRRSVEGTAAPSLLTGAETDLYALLLYETEGFERATAAELRTRYDAYSRWVAEAARRGQFVTGEDLEVDRGWMVIPSEAGPRVEESTATAAGAVLSGIFFIRAVDAGHALELTRELPHLAYGGRVLVQKTIPTDVPPGP